MRPVSCAIVTYNSASTIDRCAELASPHVDEMIIVDNHSTDGTPALLARIAIRLPNVRSHLNGSNRGFAAAVNQAIDRSREGNDVLLLNPDCFIDGEAIARLQSALVSDQTIAVAGASIRNADGSEHPATRRAAPNLLNSFLRAFRLRKRDGRHDLELAPDQSKPIADVDAVSGACMLVRREALQKVGLLDASFFLHCEDFDWCIRFRAAGWRVVVVNDAFAIHLQGVSGRGRPLFVEYQKHRGMFRYYSKHVRPRTWIVVTPLVFTGIWCRFACVAMKELIRRIVRER